MSAIVKATRNKSELRSEAAFRLKIGVANSADWCLGADTLGLLFKLASSPETVMDGLKLLHELQTHQVELEMQQQELEHSAQQHTKQMDKLKSYFEHAPFGYLIVNRDGEIIHCNSAAVMLLGSKNKSCVGQRFDSFCTVLSAYGLQDLLMHAVVEGPPVMCVLELKPGRGRPRRMQVLINKSPEEGQFLFGLSSYDQLLKV
ncbi:PAS domain-containing protein [Limnobacter parvus]|uniref:PAS domain-containing protein n=1 Tax=Limnobacter parvus TaxID=2939690 RepID=A0ABT1XHD7_9BURK|nr:PAS domain-containing protein [Limnobacter parvus]MCR2746579.1 PAS domain-containing protein [Limnobacter parvus]